ncbi:MAG: hypothetical protein KCHDKBKB_01378 [Elusimicrobia bacterium]|nr:hypothetical protein [Elusimicrobiota bacterium]
MKTKTAIEDLQAHEIMTKPVEVVRFSDSIHDVARLFTENHIGAAAVLDTKGKPVGVITKTDIVRYEEGNDGSKTVNKKDLSNINREDKPAGFHVIDEDDTVQNWMTPVIFSVKPETSLKEISRRMVKYGIHHIFVQGKNNEPLAGIVSSFDVLRQVAAETEEGVQHG